MPIIYIITLCLISTSVFAEEKTANGDEKIVHLSVGSTFTFDGKELNKFRSSCPPKIVEEIVNGKKIGKSQIDSISFINGKLGCNLRKTDYFQRHFFISGEIPDMSPLICKTKETKISEDILSIRFEFPCDFHIIGARAMFDPRDMSDMTIDSLKYNFGKNASIAVDLENKSHGINDDSRAQTKDLPTLKDVTGPKTPTTNPQ